jgi:hypothetical protein
MQEHIYQEVEVSCYQNLSCDNIIMIGYKDVSKIALTDSNSEYGI